MAYTIIQFGVNFGKWGENSQIFQIFGKNLNFTLDKH